MFKNLERAPEIIQLTNEEDIDEKGLKGRAARFVMQAGQSEQGMGPEGT
jgi:hypothetical protein